MTLLSQLLVLTWLYVCVDAAGYTHDFCWRDFTGKIPPDALVAGMDMQSKPVYIGQVLYGDKLIPGKINTNDNRIFFEYFSKEYGSTENIKILCTNANNYDWILTRHVDIRHLKEKETLVKGGFEPNCAVYIGRVNIGGDIRPGKVMCCNPDGSCYGLYTSTDGTTQLHESFEVLVHKNFDSSPDVDLRINAGVSVPRAGNARCKEITVTLFN